MHPFPNLPEGVYTAANDRQMTGKLKGTKMQLTKQLERKMLRELNALPPPVIQGRTLARLAHEHMTEEVEDLGAAAEIRCAPIHFGKEDLYSLIRCALDPARRWIPRECELDVLRNNGIISFT